MKTNFHNFLIIFSNSFFAENFLEGGSHQWIFIIGGTLVVVVVIFFTVDPEVHVIFELFRENHLHDFDVTLLALFNVQHSKTFSQQMRRNSDTSFLEPKWAVWLKYECL